jgi:hypothetical protein
MRRRRAARRAYPARYTACLQGESAQRVVSALACVAAPRRSTRAVLFAHVVQRAPHADVARQRALLRRSADVSSSCTKITHCTFWRERACSRHHAASRCHAKAACSPLCGGLTMCWSLKRQSCSASDALAAPPASPSQRSSSALASSRSDAPNSSRHAAVPRSACNAQQAAVRWRHVQDTSRCAAKHNVPGKLPRRSTHRA